MLLTPPLAPPLQGRGVPCGVLCRKRRRQPLPYKGGECACGVPLEGRGECACGAAVFYLRRREGEQKNQLPTARTMTCNVTTKAQTLAAREVALMV